MFDFDAEAAPFLTAKRVSLFFFAVAMALFMIGIAFFQLGNYYEANQTLNPGDPGRGIRLQFSGVGFILISFFVAAMTGILWAIKIAYAFFLNRVTRI